MRQSRFKGYRLGLGRVFKVVFMPLVRALLSNYDLFNNYKGNLCCSIRTAGEDWSQSPAPGGRDRDTGPGGQPSSSVWIREL